MNTYICEICGDAYIGSEKPHDCPFCGAKGNFIKPGKEANPIFLREGEISEESKGFLMETLALEIRANAIYTCMAGKAQSYVIKAMYKRLAKVELEHAVIVTKLLKIEMPEINPESCSDEEVENFKKTVELEDHATELYSEFAKKATEERIRIFFTALSHVEKGHIELIKELL